MKNKPLSTKLSKSVNKKLSGFDKAIVEAKERIKVLKRSIKTLEALRDSGMQFPEPETFEASDEVMGQEGGYEAKPRHRALPHNGKNYTDHEADLGLALCKVLYHNICCLIQSMYELGLKPEFWSQVA